MCAEVVKKRRTKSREEALSALMRECAKCEKSTGDAQRLMARWEVPSQEREWVLERLLEMKFIDNRRFAEAYLRDKLNLSGWGAQRIRLELSRKCVEREIIDELLINLDKEMMCERLKKVMSKRLRTTKYRDNYDLKNKLLRYGASLGYDYSTIKDIIEEIVKHNDTECYDSYF